MKVSCLVVSIQEVLLSFMLFWTVFIKENAQCSSSMVGNYNPCCSMPCLHRGVCAPISFNSFECICPSGYYGKHCEKSTFSKWLVDSLKLDNSRKQSLALSGRLFWSMINNIPVLHDTFLRHLYKSATNLENTIYTGWQFGRDFDIFDSYKNNSFFIRGLPPVPLECPTPLGIKGPSILPDVDSVFNLLFQRSDFKPCPLKTNLIFATFAQYLSYQLYETSLANCFYFESGKLDVPHVSDADEDGRALRSWEKGKLKTRMINGEEFPPYLEDEPTVPMYYPKGKKSVFPKWAMANKMFSITPFMFALATIWLREHNRVCDILLKDHPEWNDEKIYQTARRIILGELLTITTGEYFQHLAQYRLKLAYKPNLIHNRLFSFSNQMQLEFNLSFQWHQMLPDAIIIQGNRYNLSDIAFSNNRIVFEHGLDAIIDFMGRNSAGQITFQNCGKTFEGVMKQLIKEGRQNRLHSFNDYRRFFGLKPYKSFYELTGDKEAADALNQLYKDIDAVEFIVGNYLEKHVKTVVPSTMIFLFGPVALRGVLSNPIGSSAFWRPSTFGGKTGFDIVQKASLKKLICLNLKQNCKNNVWVSFKTPLTFK